MRLQVYFSLLLILLDGCAANSIIENNPVFDYVERFFASEVEPDSVAPTDTRYGSQNVVPAPGEELAIYDPGTEAHITVLADEVYAAASGRLCTYYYSTPNGIRSPQPSGLACQDNENRWTKVPLAIHREIPPGRN